MGYMQEGSILPLHKHLVTELTAGDTDKTESSIELAVVALPVNPLRSPVGRTTYSATGDG
jgi:hypothetical protein